MNISTKYKNHITGLRGISVIMVVLFHLDRSLFSLGYLGVDIFFVISGYVITLTFYKEYLNNNKINIISFYIRRIKRLYPALVISIILTYIIYILFSDTIYFQSITKSAFFSLIGLSNIYYLFSNQNYFINEINNPFIHTWSLGIEEQFYFIYPFILIIIFNKKIKFNEKSLVYIFFIITFFLYFFYYYTSKTIWGNFYFPLSRFWEISLGCSLFFLSKYKIKFLNAFIILVFAVFIIFLYYSSYLTTQLEIFFTCFFASILIINQNNFITNLLENKILLFIGTISYSIYLFHYPIIFFLEQYIDYYLVYFISIIFIIFISTLSYNYVEVPFRNYKYFDYYIKKILYFIFPLITLILILFSQFDNIKIRTYVNYKLFKIQETLNIINVNNYNIVKFLKNSSNLENYIFDNKNIRYCSSQFKKDLNYYLKNCYIDNNKNKLIHIIGDSQAEHLIPMILTKKEIYDFMINPMIGATFFPGSDYYYSKNFLKDTHKNKINKNYFEVSKQIINYFDSRYDDKYLIIASRFNFAINNFTFLDKNNKKMEVSKTYDYVFNILENFIESIDQNTKILFIPDAPIPPITLNECLKRLNFSLAHFESCKFDISDFIKKREKIIMIFNKLKNKHSNVFVFDFADYLCQNKICNYFYDDYKAIYSRKNHFSIEFSESFQNEFFDFFENSVSLN